MNKKKLVKAFTHAMGTAQQIKSKLNIIENVNKVVETPMELVVELQALFVKYKIITITDGKYNYYVIDTDRPYETIVMAGSSDINLFDILECMGKPTPVTHVTHGTNDWKIVYETFNEIF